MVQPTNIVNMMKVTDIYLDRSRPIVPGLKGFGSQRLRDIWCGSILKDHLGGNVDPFANHVLKPATTTDGLLRSFFLHVAMLSNCIIVKQLLHVPLTLNILFLKFCSCNGRVAWYCTRYLVRPFQTDQYHHNRPHQHP